MNLKLDDNYTIETDSNNFILRYSNTYIGKDKSTNKDKEITSKAEWFYPTLSGALNTYLNECLKRSDTVNDVYTELKRVENIIAKIKK
jgi:hypothetical protein